MCKRQPWCRLQGRPTVWEMLDALHVRLVAMVCTNFLESAVEADWDVPVPDLDLTVAGVVAHAAEGCLWYAIDLAAQGADLRAVEHRVKVDEPNKDLVDTMRSYARVVAAVIENTPDSTRGFHPMGAADPSGFAAMTCDELLIHTDDAARGLNLSFCPPGDLALAVLQRLFPWVEPTGDAWDLLRWANGRIALGEHERLSEWAWHCAPIDNWNGEIPTRPSRANNL